MGEEAGWRVVFHSDGPENGCRVRLQIPGNDIAMGDESGVTRFSWDGTYDEHGDARYRPLS